MGASDWLELRQDAQTRIETMHAHFEGHAYDPHWHDTYVIGVTRQGVQQFNCRRNRVNSTPGHVFLLEPGEIHDGNAPEAEGFTYYTLYIDPAWLDGAMARLFEETPGGFEMGFTNTLSDDPALALATMGAFNALHHHEMRIVREASLDRLLTSLTAHLSWRKTQADVQLPAAAWRARDYLHAHYMEDIGLDELAQIAGTDRFRLTRAFKSAFGVAPHAYLIQLRLARARTRLAKGDTPAEVAAVLGFADQSHFGRWFQRAYRLTPAAYRKICTRLPG
ncbi:AraC family transcriptional regulator [Silvimonas amylolytica]|uniref:Transcriptional regulator n=1 Tax=Silvimonas amylolytica TaxID=449663 RepID=A0ABQ2PRC0_9NEIS|nr:AraC family transcriptional regulator [Silvimonas amylolytica]GGP28182.1 transcriptional regulator [Silvimonas amylolytica]